MIEGNINTLLVCDDVPSKNYGTGQRLLAIKRALDELGECRILHITNGGKPVELALRDYVAPAIQPRNATRLQHLISHVTFSSYRKNQNYSKYYTKIKHEFDFQVVICSFFRNTPAVPISDIPCLLDIDALDEPKGLLTRFIWPITKLMIRRRAYDFKKIFVIRRKDMDLFSKSQLENVIFLPGFSATAEPVLNKVVKDKCILMVGSMSWKPNRDGIEFLIKSDILKFLKLRGWRLRLVGQGTDRYKNIEGVDAKGFVDSISLEYAKAGIVICPIWSGSGANIKLAEAVQYGCAIVSSEHSANAYHGLLEPGSDFLVVANKQDFVGTIVSLIDDQDLKLKLEVNAKGAAKKYFTQSHFTKIVTNAIKLSI